MFPGGFKPAERFSFSFPFDGRVALEMTSAVGESHRLHVPVPLPLENRRHPMGSVA